MKYFIGLNFQQDFLHFKKIHSFKGCFDSKYSQGPGLYIGLLKPFFLRQNIVIDNIVRELTDEIDFHFDLNQSLKINFNGIEVKGGKKKKLFLKAPLPNELKPVIESLEKFLAKKEVGTRQTEKAKNIFNIDTSLLLPIGRFYWDYDLQNGVAAAKNQWDTSFELQIKGLGLYEKVQGKWLLKRQLWNFPYVKRREEASFESHWSLSGEL